MMGFSPFKAVVKTEIALSATSCVPAKNCIFGSQSAANGPPVFVLHDPKNTRNVSQFWPCDTLVPHETSIPDQVLQTMCQSQGLSLGVVEGLDNKAKLTIRKAYGFKEFETIQIALLHKQGKLPEPKSTHRFS